VHICHITAVAGQSTVRFLHENLFYNVKYNLEKFAARATRLGYFAAAAWLGSARTFLRLRFCGFVFGCQVGPFSHKTSVTFGQTDIQLCHSIAVASHNTAHARTC